MVYALKQFVLLAICSLFFACKNSSRTKEESSTTDTTAVGNLTLPPPNATKSSVKFSNVIGWAEGQMPVAPAGFTVSKFADQFNNPRWLYQAPNGDIFVAEANTESKSVDKVKNKLSGKEDSQNMRESSNRISLLRDADGDGIPETRTVYLTGLNKPFGMLVLNNAFYVANTDGLMMYPYKAGETSNKAAGKKILDLPAGGYNNHWTRNIITNADGSKICISVGSGSNVGENGMEHEVRRACILEVNPDGTGEQVYATGLRNPVGMAWAPGTSTLWTAVNERDELGDELVPDYLAGVQRGGFYGWPYAYFGQNEDPRRKGERPDLVQKTLIPEVPLLAHTASLGLAFYNQQAFPDRYLKGAFVGQHGSWNRSELVGYKVVFVPFTNGKPIGKPEDFLTGFIADIEKGDVYGRPVGICVLQNGSMLVADDAANTIWRVSSSKQ